MHDQRPSVRVLMTIVALTLGSLCFRPATALSQAAPANAVVRLDWPQFLGPHRNGISDETALLTTWPAEGPQEVWRVPGGVGMSGLAIGKGRVVTMVQREGQQWVVVHDAETGRRLHQVGIAPEYGNTMGAGPRATPTVEGDTAFVFTGEGVLAAVDLKQGTIRWSRNVVRDLGGKPAEYGMASSPLVVDGRVIVTAGAPRGTVAAFDAQTGEPVWQTVANNGADTAGYSSPALLKIQDVDQVVAFEGKAVLGIAPQTGRLLWRYPYPTDFDCNIVTPILCDGRVFISAGENHGCAMLSLQPAGDEFRVTTAWESQGPSSVMRNEWQTSVLHDGHLHGFDNVGSAGPVTHLNCVHVASGQRKWQQLRFGKGNLILADGKLFISTLKGELVIVRATPERFEELGRKQVLRSTRQSPALAQGRLYLRDDREIVCLDVRK
jgi:outer membrane protein assembly factor BamB